MYDDPNAAFSVAVTSENWVATIGGDGRVNSVKIGDGGYSILQFFQSD